MKKKIYSLFGFCVVIVVILAAFCFRKQIEQFAAGGYAGVFVACFASTATILLPAPGILVVLQYAQFLNPILVICIGGLGTSLGEMLGYLLGRTGKEIVNLNTDNKALNLFKKYPYITVLVFSVIPLPFFDVVGVASGMTKLNVLKFWSICFIGKVIKMAVYVFLFERLLLLA